LRITLPINVRSEHDRIGGNRFTLLRFDVPVGEADPVVRMQRLHELVAAQRAEPSIPHTQRVAAVLDLLPPAVMGGMLKHIDAVVSNVPGLPVPVYLSGAKVTAFYPFGPTSGAAVNLTLLSYDGTCHIGVNIDVGAVPDPDLLVTCLREGIAEIVDVGRAADGESTPVTSITEEVG
jgi:diacylglycerol O-acyltransferase / wax synthase